MRRGSHREAQERFEERRRREDEARRLHEAIPTLKTLKIDVAELVQGSSIPVARYTKHIVVQRAPALFFLPCGDSDCEDGGYEITREVMLKLTGLTESFDGTLECRGRRKNGAPCTRRLQFGAQASYSA